VAANLPFNVGPRTVFVIVTFAVPVMVCFFFVDRPFRFALCVAAILAPTTYTELGGTAQYSERSFFGILKIEESNARRGYFYRVDRALSEKAVAEARAAGVPASVLDKLAPLGDKQLPYDEFVSAVHKLVPAAELAPHEAALLRAARADVRPELVRTPDDKPAIMNLIQVRRLVHGTTLHGTQVSEDKRHAYDTLQLMTFGNLWDNVAVAGAQTAYDLRQEPLTYYHRTGPVGAMFRELERRGRSYDHVAMVGLGTGSVSCYARPGQQLTFYEIDPLVKKLVADTDKHFSYVRDAEKRAGIGGDGKRYEGAKLDFRMGDARLKLKDTQDKYSLLLVDAFSSDSIPVHLLTVEAVQLYLERIKDDGILALHISNKYVSLEPVVAAIAEKLGLVAYVWNDTHRDEDDSIERLGKTSSSWVALARKKEHLGDRIASPAGDLVGEYDGGTQLAAVIKATHPGAPLEADGPIGGARLVRLLKASSPEFAAAFPGALPDAETAAKWLTDRNDAHGRAFAALLRVPAAAPDKLLDLVTRLYPEVVPALKEGKGGEWLEARDAPGKRYAELLRRYGGDAAVATVAQAEGLAQWLEARKDDPAAQRYAQWLRKYRSPYTTLMSILVGETGYGFHPVAGLKNLGAWTDDYADVMRVMMIPELQALRRFFGLPTLNDR
jgi:hypothetical protein